MKPEMIRNMLIRMQEKYYELTEEEKDFILLFMVRTGNEEKAKELMDSLLVSSSEKESEELIKKYREMMEPREVWVEAIEEFYIVMEQLHLEEKAALDKLQAILRENGIALEGEEVN